MSQFDKYTVTDYVDGLRSFLRMVKKDFHQEVGITRVPGDAAKGRIPRFNKVADASGELKVSRRVEDDRLADVVQNLEVLVNAKASRCEAKDTTLCERFSLAHDYTGFNDAQVSRELDVSRELVRRWGAAINQPSNLPAIAELFNVPLKWLEEGGEKNLPANSHLGVRVGEDALFWREQLYSLTVEVVSDIPDGSTEDYSRAFIEWAVFNKPEFSRAARRAGGRWQLVQGGLFFAPWIPIKEHGLTRKKFSEKVEAIIEEELEAKPTISAAWKAIDERCKALGLKVKEDYPVKISLHKRIDRENERAEKFGIDLNELVAASVAIQTK